MEIKVAVQQVHFHLPANVLSPNPKEAKTESILSREDWLKMLSSLQKHELQTLQEIIQSLQED